jgi:archaetidylserine synthase
MEPRFVGRLSAADAVTVANAALGFFAIVAAFDDPDLAARFVLLAGITDGLDGLLARAYGSSAAGEYLDSLADVSSFSLAPAVIVFAVVRAQWDVTFGTMTLRAVATAALPAAFVAMAVLRLGMYTAFDTDDEETQGVPSTLAATLIAAAVVAHVTTPAILLGATGLFVYLMVSPVRYPDLHASDALVMGVVHAGAVFFPTVLDRTFPLALLTLAGSYLLLSPWLYWRGDWLLARLGAPEADT